MEDKKQADELTVCKTVWAKMTGLTQLQQQFVMNYLGMKIRERLLTEETSARDKAYAEAKQSAKPVDESLPRSLSELASSAQMNKPS